MARPIEYDRDLVLDKAVDAFWRQGYCATSISQLVSVTKLKPGSLYAAFDSKEGVFQASVDHYGRRSVMTIRGLLEAGATPLAGIKDYFHGLQKSSLEKDSRRGCFLVNTLLELGSHNEGVRAQVFYYLWQIESCFRDALQAAIDQGELPPYQQAGPLAKYLMNNIRGLRILDRAGGDPQEFTAIIEQLFLTIGGRKNGLAVHPELS